METLPNTATTHARQQVPGSLLHYAGYRAIERLASALPPVAQYALARIAAAAYCKLDTRARKAVESNMRAALGDGVPPHEIRAAARAVFQSFGRFVCEFIGRRSLSPEFIRDHVSVCGRENLDAALALGRGAILCSGHYSNWELGPAAIAQMGIPVTAIVQQHSVQKIDNLFVSRRAKAGVRIAHTGGGAFVALKALRRKECVAILGDRPTGGPVLRVNFLGRSTEFPQGPWRMAELSGAPLLPVFVLREHSNYILEIGCPLQNMGYNTCGGTHHRATDLAQRWAEIFEARVRADPSQWHVFFPVWDTDAF